jgi:hypothetical protein
MILRGLIIVVSVASGAAYAADPPTIAVAGQAPQVSRVPQPPAMPPSPVQVFRNMLAMTPEQRVRAMEGRQPKTREFLISKLKEFEALSPEERENRLRTMELRWQLLPLMSMAPSNRVLRIQTIPERDRPLIEERLRLWDKLSPEQQRDVLECEPALSAFASPGTRVPTSSVGWPVSTNVQARINQSTAYLNSLHPEKRAELYQNFQEFFELSDKEKAKALDSIQMLSDAERRQMERTLQAFDKLPPAQREQCIEGFQKFAALSREEQQQFLRSVERWQAMSARDRQIWRGLVSRKAVPQPPLPPGFRTGGFWPASNSLVSTNR